jgi:hypothetical protein
MLQGKIESATERATQRRERERTGRQQELGFGSTRDGPLATN